MVFGNGLGRVSCIVQRAGHILQLDRLEALPHNHLELEVFYSVRDKMSKVTKGT